VVPPARTAETAADGTDLEGQLRQHLGAPGPAPVTGSRPAIEAPPMATPARGLPAVKSPPRRAMGTAAALAPGPLLDQARVADSAFAAGDFDTCVRTCLETVRRALAYAGEGNTTASLALLLRVDGPDLLKLEAMASHHAPLRVDDAAFALYVVMQTFIRLSAAGLPPQAD
jgi:hypothetical protein